MTSRFDIISIFTAALTALGLCLAAIPAGAAPSYPLEIGPDGRQLLDSNGQPVFLNADTPWHLIARLDRGEVIEFLDDRQAQGFNALLLSLVVPDFYSGTSNNAYGEPPFLTPGDFSTPNEAYFEHADWILEQARQRGIMVLLCHTYVGWGCGPEGWCEEMKAQGTTAMRNWGRWLGQRYRDQTNIIWVNGGDVDASDYGAGAHVDAIAEGILQYDGNHLHTAHCSRLLSGADCYDRPWLDIDTSYGNCEDTAQEVMSSYTDSPTRPTIYIEGEYEASPTYQPSPACLRRQAWVAVLGGSFGHTYGNSDVWDFPAGWSDALVTESTQAMQVMRELIEARAWQKLEPDYDHTVMTYGYSNISSELYAATAMASDGSSILAYLPFQRTVTMALDGVSGQEAEAWWMDPATGEATLAGVYPTIGTQDLTPPGTGDWVLVIDDASAPLADPWAAPTAASPAPRVQLTLAAPVPNPFNPRTKISFSATDGVRVRAAVYDARGRQVAVLFDGPGTGQVQELLWDAKDLPSGVYHLKVSAGDRVQTRKLALVR